MEMKMTESKPTNMLIYGASVASVLLSLSMMLKKSPGAANFVGLWAPTILSIGILLKENKILDLERKNLKQKLV